MTTLRQLARRAVAGAGTPLVLVMCGSFSPVTYMHLRLFELARDYFKRHHQARFQVIAGIVSPVSDRYQKKGLAPGRHRYEMCRLAVADSDWIVVDDWEILQSDWTRTRVVLQHFEDELNADNAEARVRVMLLSGGDLVDSFATPNLWSDEDLVEIVGRMGLVAIERQGTDLAKVITNSPILSKYQLNEHIFVVPQPVVNDISSTSIRGLVGAGQSIHYLTPPAVVQYIHDHKLYRHGANAHIQ